MDIWEASTPVPKASFPNDYRLKKTLKDTCYNTVVTEDLIKDDGLPLVKNFLNKELGEDDIAKTWDEFNDLTKEEENIEDFLSGLPKMQAE